MIKPQFTVRAVSKSPNQIELHMKDHRFNKYIKSGPVKKIIAGYEQRLNENDYFNNENKEFISERARDFLNDRIAKDLADELTPEERMFMSLTIQTNVIKKRYEAEQALKKIGLKNIRRISEAVLNNAMKRDSHMQTIESIYKAAGENGQTELTKEQMKLVDKEWKLFDKYDNNRLASVQKRKNYIRYNEELAKQSSETWKAYQYLGMPVSGSKR